MVEGGAISTGHARALLALNDTQHSLRLANETVAEALSVRELERRVRELLKPESTSAAPARGTSAPGGKPMPTDPGVRRIEDDLRRYLQTDVKVHVSASAQGRIEVSFYSNDDLDRILDLVLRERRQDY
jgi:ParB family chromosome partitioning protein